MFVMNNHEEWAVDLHGWTGGEAPDLDGGDGRGLCSLFVHLDVGLVLDVVDEQTATRVDSGEVGGPRERLVHAEGDQDGFQRRLVVQLEAGKRQVELLRGEAGLPCLPALFVELLDDVLFQYSIEGTRRQTGKQVPGNLLGFRRHSLKKHGPFGVAFRQASVRTASPRIRTI